MHVAIIFSHIGNYHLARLSAASKMCEARGWKMTAIQSIQKTKEHPWGDLAETEGFSIETLISSSENTSEKKEESALHPESPEAVAALTPRLNQLKPDVIAIPGWGFPLSQAALRWCQQNRVPAVLMSESKRDDEERTWWKEQLKYWLYVRKYAAALVGGAAHRDYLVQLGFEKNRIFYGYDAVDNDFFKEQANSARENATLVRQQQPQIPDKPYFLSVTRLIPRKNIARLVEAYAQYRDAVGTDDAWPLVICGSGTELPIIEQLIERHNLKELVLLPGFLTYQQIGYWYGLAGAFVHPALVEQWGLVVNEACAAGLPILCSRTVGACESLVSDGENGFAFSPEDVEEIRQALVKMHRIEKCDRKQMGQVSQQLVEQCSPAQFGQGLAEAIDVALSDASRPVSSPASV